MHWLTAQDRKGCDSTVYESFIAERLVLRRYSKEEHYSLLVFNDPTSKSKQKLSPSRNNCLLFSRLYMGLSNQKEKPHEFFHHEKQSSIPPSLSQEGKLRLSLKIY